VSTAKGVGRSHGETLDVSLLKKPMIVRFTSPGLTNWELLVKAEDLMEALRDEGVLPEPDGTRERLQSLVANLENNGWGENQVISVQELRDVLDPTPPFQFPRTHAAVVRGWTRENRRYVDFTRLGTTWRDNLGIAKGEDDIRKQYARLEVIHPGMAKDNPDAEPTEEDSQPW
jgi:hypothetical protein